MENRVKALEEKIKGLEEGNRENEKRIAKIEGSKELQEYQFKTIMESIQEMKIDLKELKETPSKRWDLVITGIITAVIGGAIAFIGSKIL